jgi:hypothetical protein
MNAIAVGLVMLVTALGFGSIEPARDANRDTMPSLDEAARAWDVTARIAAATQRDHRAAIESFSLVTVDVTERGLAPSSCR